MLGPVLALLVGCTEKPEAVRAKPPMPTVASSSVTEARTPETEWLGLLALAARRDSAGIIGFESDDSSVVALRNVLLSDLETGVFLAAFAPPEPIYQPLLDLQSITARSGILSPGILRAKVDTSGSVVALEWWRKTDFPEVNQIAEDTVKSWRYRPALREGLFVPTEVVITIRF